MNAEDLKDLLNYRMWADYLPSIRNLRVSEGNWGDVIDRDNLYDNLYAGKWQAINNSVFDGMELKPHTKNLVHSGSDDYARLAASARPNVECMPIVMSKTAQEEAQLYEAIAGSHWAYNKFDRSIVNLAYDLVRGRAYVDVWWDPSCPYPKFKRLDPRFCFPEYDEDELFDLITVNVKKRSWADHKWPELGLGGEGEATENVEIIDYYSRDVRAKVICGTKSNKPGGKLVGRSYVQVVEPNLTGIVPVAWSKLDTADGEFRGLFDQVAVPMLARNTSIAYALKYLEKTAFAERLFVDVDPNQSGPNAKLVGYSSDARVETVSPARIAPEFFGALDILREEAHEEAGIAPTRAGRLDPSIISAAGISASQGQQSTNVEYLQSLLAALREQIHEIAFRVDKTYLDFRKPLLVPSTRKEYTPSIAIGDYPHVEVKYGVGSGIDPLNRGVYLFQAAGNQFISREYGRRQLPGITEAVSEERRIERELMRGVTLQQIAAVSPLSTKARFVELQDEGKDLPEILKILSDEGMVLDPNEQPQMPPGPEAVPPTGDEQALALEKGASAPAGPAGPGAVPTDPASVALLQALAAQGGRGAITQNISRPF